MLKFDEVDIKKTLLDLDMKLRPQALIFHPSKMRYIAELVPDIEERVELLPTMTVPEDTWYLVDREEIEKWRPVPLTKADFRPECCKSCEFNADCIFDSEECEE